MNAPGRGSEFSLGREHDASQEVTGVFARLTDLINSDSDIRALLLGMVEVAARLCSTSMASAHLCDDQGNFEYSVSTGLPRRLTDEIDRLGKTQWLSDFLLGLSAPVVLHPAPSNHYPTPLHKLAASHGVCTLVSLPLLFRGKLIGVMLLYHADLHEYKAGEFDLLQGVASYMALSIANAQLLDTRQWEQKAQDQFLDVVSHELRTPLTSIMGFTQIIRRRISTARDIDSRVRDQLDLLWGQAQRLNRLLDTFVDVSNLQRGEFAVEHNRLDVAALLRSALDQSLTQSRSGHRFDLDIPDDPIWLYGDAKRLEHVFGHVLSNALRYSPVEKPVGVICKHDPGEQEVVVSITDHGPGIPPEMQKEIFKRFYPSDTRRSGGMGVGLYVSRAIVDAHGGRLSLQSSPGRGTTIQIHLPT